MNPSEVIDALGVSAGMIVGDFGSGDGAFARILSERVGEQGVVYAFDIQKELVTKLAADARHEKLQNIRALWVDLEEEGGTKLPDATLDVAVVANVLFQAERRDVFLAEVARVLRQNGRALIVDWSDSFGHLGPHPDQVVSAQTARTLADGAGFAFDRDISAGAHHYGIVFRKRSSTS